MSEKLSKAEEMAAKQCELILKTCFINRFNGKKSEKRILVVSDISMIVYKESKDSLSEEDNILWTEISSYNFDKDHGIFDMKYEKKKQLKFSALDENKEADTNFLSEKFNIIIASQRTPSELKEIKFKENSANKSMVYGFLGRFNGSFKKGKNNKPNKVANNYIMRT